MVEFTADARLVERSIPEHGDPNERLEFVVEVFDKKSFVGYFTDNLTGCFVSKASVGSVFYTRREWQQACSLGDVLHVADKEIKVMRYVLEDERERVGA